MVAAPPMTNHLGPSAGEVGGLFAGVVALVASIGAGARWLLNWKERRAQTLHAKLLKWEEKLEAREAKVDADQAAELDSLKVTVKEIQRQQLAQLTAYHIVTNELRRIDPTNQALSRADEILKAAFPLYPGLPGDMAAMLRQLDDPPSTKG